MCGDEKARCEVENSRSTTVTKRYSSRTKNNNYIINVLHRKDSPHINVSGIYDCNWTRRFMCFNFDTVINELDTKNNEIRS